MNDKSRDIIDYHIRNHSISLDVSLGDHDNYMHTI